MAYVVNQPVATGVTLTPSVASPQTVNFVPVSVVFTAAATGSFSYRYQFSTSTNAGSTWTIQQAYGTAATWTMTTATLGIYRVRVEVKTNLSAVAADVSAFVDHQLVAPDPATGVRLTPSLASPQAPGTAVVWTAQGQGSTGYQYQFWLNDGAGWTIVQAYGTAATWTMPTSTPAGTYLVGVWVRTSSGVVYDATFTAPAYTLGNAPATGVRLTPSLASPQAAGTAVVWTAQGQGSTGYQYQFWLNNGTGWTIVQAYGIAATWTMPTSAPAGTYLVGVWVRTSSAAAYDATFIVPAYALQ